MAWTSMIARRPSVRSLTVVDPFFGAVAFVGVPLAGSTVEIADFEDDP